MADEKKKEKETEGKTEEPKADKPKGNNKFMFIGLIAGVLVINTVMAFILVQVTSPKKEKVTEDANKKDTAHAEAEHSTHVAATTADAPTEAVVNIAGTDGERFLKIAVAFEYDDVAHPMLLEALTQRTPKIKSMMIEYLSKLTLVEVTEPEAKEKIRKDLLRIVNSSIPKEEGAIRDVYIVNYIIQ
jgi:flagellar basal body-associated protein FliL